MKRLVLGWEVVVNLVVEEQPSSVDYAHLSKLNGVKIVFGVSVGDN